MGWIRLAISLAIVCLPACAAKGLLAGRVVDENGAGVAGARIWVRPAGSPPDTSLEPSAISEPTGAFRLSLPAPGSYVVRVEAPGYFALNAPVQVGSRLPELNLVLNRIREQFQSLDVRAAPSSLDLEQTSSIQRLSGVSILDVPYPATRDLRNALKLMQGVVQDASGGVHFNGSAENQVLYTLDGFNISDPLTGQFQTRLSVDSVRTLEYSSGRFSPEFGKGSAGALAIRTELGTDEFRYNATNFVPGIDTKKGLHIGTWDPRVTVSGPLVRGRAWFANAVDAEYSVLVIDGLPKGQDRTTSLRASELWHGQVNLTPAHIFYTDFLINYWNAPGTGLSALDPPSTTINRRQRSWFYSLKDQIYIARDTLLEFGFGENRTFNRQIPQGPDDYQITPFGRRGNYFIDSTQTARRDQFLANLFLAPWHASGSHHLKAGLDLDRIHYAQDFRRTAYENYGLSGQLLTRTTFGGSGILSRPSLEASSYLMDVWNARPNLVLELGVRQDWDELIRQPLISPRFSFSYSPRQWKNTRFAGGYAVIYDSTTLQLFTRPDDQYAINTAFHPDGSVAYGPSLTVFTIPNAHLQAPRYQNWSFEMNRRLPRRMELTLSLLRKRGAHGFTFVNALAPGAEPPPDVIARYGPGPFGAVYELANYRRDVYDAASLTIQHTFGKQYAWMAGYTRSRALSNAVVDISVDQPMLLTGSSNIGRLSWDAPNRWLSWGYLPTPWKKWAVSYLLEARDGFPFSVQQDTGVVVGNVNSYRLPFYFSLNLHVERRFRLRGYNLALRGGFNNITGHNNPTVVNSTIGSPQFLQTFGSEGRHFVLRLRWLGKS